MKKLPILILTFVFVFNLYGQDQALQLFNSKYSVFLSDFAPDVNLKLNNEDIDRFREYFKNLHEGLKEIEKYRYDVLIEGKFFTDKELKNLEKENQVNELEGLLKNYAVALKIFLGINHEYGLGKEECLKTYSNFKLCIERKDYETALIYRRELYTFYPKFKNAYSKGDHLICIKIEDSQSDKKELWIDTLLMHYDQRIKYLGNEKIYGKGYLLGKKGGYIYHYRKESALKEAYELLKQSVDTEKENSKYTAVKDFFDASMDMGDIGEIDAIEIADNFSISVEVLNKSINIHTDLVEEEKKKENPGLKKVEKLKKIIANNTKASEYITKKFASSEYSKCEYLIPAFKEHFDEHKTDTVWLEKVIGVLSWKECVEDPFYQDVSVRLYSLKPSANTAALIGASFLKERKYSDALKYYKNAYEKEEDNNKKAEYYYSAAYILYIIKNYSESRSLARKAIEYKKDFGKPYILIARLYAGSYAKCGSDKFEKAAVYWVAVDKLIKAKNVDASCEKEANELINKYTENYPDKEKGFMDLLYEGTEYKVNCWIQEITRVRYID